jgi:hypothetical protein
MKFDDLCRRDESGTMRNNLFSFNRGTDRPEERRTARPACSGHKDRNALIVHCQECRHGQDLGDQRCFKGVIRLLAADPSGVREVTLDRDWQITYGPECVDVLTGIGDIIRFCNGLSYQNPFDDCAACPSNPRSVVSRIVDCLPRAAPELDPRNSCPSGGHGKTCEQCARSLRSNLDHVHLMLERSERRINKVAYRVVMADEH